MYTAQRVQSKIRAISSKSHSLFSASNCEKKKGSISETGEWTDRYAGVQKDASVSYEECPEWRLVKRIVAGCSGANLFS